MAFGQQNSRRSALKIKTEPRLGTLQPYSRSASPVSTKAIPQYQRSQQPNKLQKQRKGANPLQRQASRRVVSFDLSTVSDHSTRALIDTHAKTVARYPRYTTPFIHRAVLKKTRNGRAATVYHRPIPQGPSCQAPNSQFPQTITQRSESHEQESRPYSPPLPPLPLVRDEQWSRYPAADQCDSFIPSGSSSPLSMPEAPSSLENALSHRSSSQLPPPYIQGESSNQTSNAMTESTVSLPALPRIFEMAENTKHQRLSLPLDMEKPLPPRPSTLIEQFSPTSLHRRWTITSHPSTQGHSSSNDILPDDLLSIRGIAPSTLYQIASSISESFSTPISSSFRIEEELRTPTSDLNPKLQELTYSFVESERAYVNTLRATVANDSNPPPVDLLLSFLSIIEVSEEFLRGMQQSPSPLGIANAFLDTCGKLEMHLLQWSTEASKFVELNGATEIQAKTSKQPATVGQSKANIKGTSSQKKEFSIGSLFKKKQPQKSADNSPNTIIPDALWQRSAGGPGLWEMAVLPTQRTMRYAFLFKETLSHLEVSDTAYQATERAFHAATCIAQKMTRAQQRPSLYFV